MKDKNWWHDRRYWYHDGIWRYDGEDGWWYDCDGEIEPKLDIDVEILSLEKPILLYYYNPINLVEYTYAIYCN